MPELYYLLRRRAREVSLSHITSGNMSRRIASKEVVRLLLANQPPAPA